MQLRPYQEEGLQALWSYFMTESGNPVLAWPTGSGKSLVPAEFIRRTMYHYPNQRFLVTTHVKELIKQNYEKLIGNKKQIGLWLVLAASALMLIAALFPDIQLKEEKKV